MSAAEEQAGEGAKTVQELRSSGNEASVAAEATEGQTSGSGAVANLDGAASGANVGGHAEGHEQLAEVLDTEGKGLGLSDVPVKPAGSIERDLETAPSLLPAPPLSPHPADELHAPDSPTTSLIAVLRDQLRLLSDQSSELNAKLVASISKHADLLDTHEALSIQHAELSKKADGLAQDKKQWEESMKTGLLVERSQITLEMQRLASGLVEEERRRGSAEERRRKVEEEVDELAASLFDQANTMVAQERHGRIEAEERLKATEDNLLAAEAAMRDMQVHLQSMPTASAGLAEDPMTAAHSAKAAGGAEQVGPVIVRRFLSSHMPYTEYLAFLAHLRSLRPLKETSKALFPPPLLASLASQSFLARITVEDHEPTLRLEAAPDLSWLSRRAVTAAILSGDLIIEPVPATQVLQGSTGLDIGCAMCGKPVFPGAPPHTHTRPLSPGGAGNQFGPPPQHPGRSTSGGRFSLKPFFNATASPSNNPSPTQSPLASPALGKDFDTTSVPATSTTSSALPAVFVFRVAKSTTNTGSADANAEKAKMYPLCRSGWCLERLRATCELWHFVRAGLVGVVWSGDDGYVLATEAAAAQHAQQKRLSQTLASPAIAAQSDESKAAKRASAPAGPELGASPLSAANSATAGSGIEPPRRKSGWGLGFKWKSNASATGSASNSAAASPPSSPRRLPPPIAEKEEVPQSGLGAPLELDKEGAEDAGAPALPPRPSTELRPEASLADEKQGAERGQEAENEATDRDAAATTDADHDDSKLGVRPDLSRQASASSFASANETFATASAAGTAHSPESTHADVVPHTTQPPVEQSEEGGSTEKVDLASPVEATTGIVPSADAAEANSEEKPVPPPIPRRAAGRPKSVIIARSAAPSPKPDDSEDAQRQTSLLEDTAFEGQDGSDADKMIPPLPARPPKTPQLNISSASNPNLARTPIVPDGERSYLPPPSARFSDAQGAQDVGEEDNWEAKTWRQVVKLREAMWRARVGVMDEED